MKTALISGVTGQDGAYLAKFLHEKEYNVVGLVIDKLNLDTDNLQYLQLENLITLENVDLLSMSSITQIIEKYNPDEIYHLAAQSSVGMSFQKPYETISLNIMSTTNFLEAIRKVNPKIRFFHPSSGDMYGTLKKEDMPVTESSILRPISPYGASKVSSHYITINYREAYDLFCTCAILFNHESALRGKNFVIKKVLNTAVKISMGLANSLKIGNMTVYRDWGYAPFYVKAFYQMLQQDKPNDYIICSGEAHCLEEFVNEIFNNLNLDRDKYLDFDKSLLRPSDFDILYGDNTKAKNKLGWEYNMSFKELINTLVEDEKKYVKWEIGQ